MLTYNEQNDVFHALAHETRRQIMDILKLNPGCAVGELASRFDVTRIAVMNHLTVLEKAGLIISEKAGRSRKLYLNIAPLQMIYDRWTDEYSAYWGPRMTEVKYLAEQAHQNKQGGQDA